MTALAPAFRADSAWLRRANLQQLLGALQALKVRLSNCQIATELELRQRRWIRHRAWALRRGEFERYLAGFGSHQRFAAFARIASRIPDELTYWRLLRDTWTSDDAPGLHTGTWAALWTARAGTSHVMLPEEQQALASLPDPLPIWRGTGRPKTDRGWSWTIDPARAVWFARWHEDNSRIRMLYGVPALGTPTVLVGTVPRDRVLAFFSERGEDEIVVPFDAVQIEQELRGDDASSLYPDYHPDSGAGTP